MTRAKQIRVLLLLMLLTPLVYAFSLPSDPAPKWDRTKVIAIYPYNSDGSEAAARMIAGLDLDDLRGIEEFLRDQARNYALPLRKPFSVRLGRPISSAPSMPQSGHGIDGLKWAFGLRWWHWWHDTQGLQPDIVVVASFSELTDTPQRLHSIGMPKPRLALVNLIAHPDHLERNLVTLTHEILHTVGANDHYVASTGFPAWPEGFADPDQQPRFPQPAAELMGGRIPLSPEIAREARTLEEAVIGPQTARDIGWSAP